MSKTIKTLRNIARTILLILAIFWFTFALFSGSEQMGGGVMGVVKNSPNAIPWLLLFGLVWLVWKKELIGGTLIALMGIWTIFFFKTYETWQTFITLSLPLTLLGVIFIASWKSSKEQ